MPQRRQRFPSSPRRTPARTSLLARWGWPSSNAGSSPCPGSPSSASPPAGTVGVSASSTGTSGRARSIHRWRRPRRLRRQSMTRSSPRLAPGRAVPFAGDQDAWHAPTQCVWDAAYWTALVACVLACGWAVPDDLVEVWNWYADGHWPSGFADEPGDGPGWQLVYPRRLLVY